MARFVLLCIAKVANADKSLYQSSLTLALLRCILTEGRVVYDGLDVAKLNLDALRSNVTIIPQVVSLHVSSSCLHL